MRLRKVDEKIILKKFKTGTNFIITGKPSLWSSRLNKKCPISKNTNLSYPYYGQIKSIESAPSLSIAIDDGEFGWSLSTLVDEGLIFTIKEYRKMKIEKLNKTL